MTSRQLSVPVQKIPPEGVELNGSVALSALDIDDDTRISCPGPLLFTLRVSLVHGSVLARGRLHTTLRCRCDRCLAYYDSPVSTDDVCHLIDAADRNVVDLTEGVREDILLAFPQRCLCRTDCRGLCPVCGRNLNVRACSCLPPDSGEETWGALDGLGLRADADG